MKSRRSGTVVAMSDERRVEMVERKRHCQRPAGVALVSSRHFKVVPGRARIADAGCGLAGDGHQMATQAA